MWKYIKPGIKMLCIHSGDWYGLTYGKTYEVFELIHKMVVKNDQNEYLLLTSSRFGYFFRISNESLCEYIGIE